MASRRTGSPPPHPSCRWGTRSARSSPTRSWSPVRPGRRRRRGRCASSRPPLRVAPVPSRRGSTPPPARMKHLADLVLDFTVEGKLRFLANADFGAEDRPGAPPPRPGTARTSPVRYAFDDVWSIAGRGEWLGPIPTAGPRRPSRRTRTPRRRHPHAIGWAPNANFVVKLEQRLDWIDTGRRRSPLPVRPERRGYLADRKTTTMLGVVAKTNWTTLPNRMSVSHEMKPGIPNLATVPTSARNQRDTRWKREYLA